MMRSWLKFRKNKQSAHAGKHRLPPVNIEAEGYQLLGQDGYVRIIQDNRELTSNLAVHSAILVEGIWHDSHMAVWDLTPRPGATPVFHLSWEALGVRQNWTFDKQKTGMRWTVSMEIAGPCRVERVQAGISLREEYVRWFCGAEEGEFVPPGNTWLRALLREEKYEKLGLEATDGLPAIVCANHSQARVLLECPSIEQERSRIIHFEQDVDPQSDSLSREWFAVTIQLLDARDPRRFCVLKERECARIRARREISEEGLRLRVEESAVRIYYHEKEVTCGRGMYTCFDAEGKRYYSEQVERNMLCEKYSDTYMKIIIDFRPHCQAIQTWNVTVGKGGVISWEIVMEALAPLVISERRAGIMVGDAYTHWFNSLEDAKFPDEFKAEEVAADDCADRLLGAYPHSEGPGFAFMLEMGACGLIQNGSVHSRARLFQGHILREEAVGDERGAMMQFFKADIAVFATDKQLDNYIDKSLPVHRPVEIITLFSDSARVHDRIAGKNEFDMLTQRMAELQKACAPFNLQIGVSRYNFFKLHEILQYALHLVGRRVDLSTVTLDIFPLKLLWQHFLGYIDLLKILVMPLDTIEFVWCDKELLSIIAQVQKKAATDNEDEVLRLLGIICEHAFVGPQVVVVDPFHRCNANCIHCWVHTPGITHPQEFLDRKLEFDRFKEMVDDMAQLHTHKIIFQGDGEPLLCGMFLDMVHYARDKGIKVSFFTNGILLNKAFAQAAIDREVDEIFCSLPAGTVQTYGKIVTKQESTVFQDILSNLKLLGEMKKEQGKSYPRLIMTHVIHTMNARELMDMAQNDVAVGADVVRFYLVRLDDNIHFLKLTQEDIAVLRESYVRIKEYLKDKPIVLLDTTDFQLSNFDQSSGDWSKSVFLEEGCPLGWSFCLVPAVGDISMCCHLRTVGYLAEKSFKDIWQSEQYEQFRYQAKYMKHHTHVRFLNGMPLFDEHCEHCDTHQVIRNIWEQARSFGLDKYIKQ